VKAILSRSTASFGIALLAAVSVVQFISMKAPFGTTSALYVSDFGEAAIIGISAIVVLWAAGHYGRTPIGRAWMFVGLGALCFAVGDTIWAVLESVMGQQPFPSLADVFFCGSYVLIAAGLTSAVAAYRRLVPERAPIVTAVLVAATGSIALYVGLLKSLLADTSVGMFARVLSTAYPLGDLMLEFAPALCVILLLRKLGGGCLAWPWWVASFAVICLAVTDTGYAWMQQTGGDVATSWVNVGWMLGFALLALAASVAYDVHQSASVPTPAEKAALASA
jgi:hypothetical protein